MSLLDTPCNRSYDWGFRPSGPEWPVRASFARGQANSLWGTLFKGLLVDAYGSTNVKRGGALEAAGAGVARKWHVIDAGGQVLGRVATLAAKLLQGKHKAVYTPHIDTGDHVVVVNAGTVKLTGRKEDQKLYRRHSGYEGGLREERAGVVRKRQPVRLVEEAVRGMLPKTKMGDQMYRKLKVYARADHPHTAQQPAKIEVQ